MHLIHQTAYAFKNDQLVHVSDVVSGLSCGCVCTLCKNDLIAKKGKINVHHFAHARETDCVGGAETSLHILSKELFKEMESVALPQYLFERERVLRPGYIRITYQQIVAKGGEARITKVDIEKAEDKFKPDVTLLCGEKTLLIEIAVTHKVDKKKLRLLRKSGMPAIEIRLEFSDALLSKDELRNKLQNDLASKHWLFHPRQREAERVFYEKLRTAIRAAHRASQKNSSSRAPSQAVSSATMRSSNSNVERDRMAYEFFLKYKRQPTDNEYQNLRALLYKKKDDYPKR
jgi:hypothetical protein